ncbi:MAG: BlaR1 family beta-lactam sensor/signal transducer [Eubacteriales bacterium]|nr:BlaR1 family beta-lactam sensor/signal transducer [Eubacteriales bacterium]
MGNFMICFLICNIFICGIIGLLLIVKRLFKNNLSGRLHYNLWFVLLGLLAVPFLPFHFTGLPQILLWFQSLGGFSLSDAGAVMSETTVETLTGNTNWINDFTLSVNSRAPGVTGYLLAGIWLAGILAMILLVIKSYLRLHNLKQSALPVQNPNVRRLYEQCLKEIGIVREIQVYSTVFLKSPIIVGLLKPRIYLPIHLISDHKESEMKYMLLHELQHYKHKDPFASCLMNLAGIIYWFNPLVWYSLREMRNDREVACDTSVLNMLDENAYEDYGNTLINFAEKVSFTPFPFSAGLGGSMKQMKRRIINIASYEKPSLMKRLKSITIFILTAILLIGLAPFISTYAADNLHYQWDSSAEEITNIDLSSYFREYEGSFVLYDTEKDSWKIYDEEHALLRVAPDSTYKIYDALFGLEEGVITPDNTFMEWNGETFPIELWNGDQTLQTAMPASVNWYFQHLDEQLGTGIISDYIKEIGYGNENINDDLSSYWMESALKISPVEQVKLLTDLYQNNFAFALENVQAVKDAIFLSASGSDSLYGKTGTGCIDGRNMNGWFVGYVESIDTTYIFATNIRSNANADGKQASEITLSVLNDLNIFQNKMGKST